MLLLVVLFIVIGLIAGDFYKVPLIVVFVLVVAYALTITRIDARTKQPLRFMDRLHIFSRGAGHKSLLQMIWIFVLAGAFAESAKEMGAIDTMVQLAMRVTPPQIIHVGLFSAALLVSIGVGTSVGTIVAIVPFAVALAESAGLQIEMCVGAVIGGAFFGDNMSFISDTTIAATQCMGISMREKFVANLRVALPAAIITAAIYVVLGAHTEGRIVETTTIHWPLILPYLYVLVASLAGMHVLVVLFTANILTGIIGVATAQFDMGGWMASMTHGIGNMGELILLSMIAGGLLALIEYNGGVTWLIYKLSRRVTTARGAGFTIAALVSLVDMCTANNTIAILSVGDISRDISDHYGLSRRRAASVLDTYSCCMQGLLPYGAQILMAAGIASVSPVHLVPYVFYPIVLMFCASFYLLRREEKPIAKS